MFIINIIFRLLNSYNVLTIEVVNISYVRAPGGGGGGGGNMDDCSK